MILNFEDITLRSWAESDTRNLYNLPKNPNIGNKNHIFSKRNICYNLYSRLCGLLFPPNCNKNWGKDSAEIGYWIGEKYQNKGIITKASRILIERAFKDLNVNGIYGTFNLDNFKSKKVMEKLRFKYYKDKEKVDGVNKKYKLIAMILTKNDFIKI